MRFPTCPGTLGLWGALAGGLVMLGVGIGRAADVSLDPDLTPDIATTVASEPFPQVTCTGSNAAAVADVIRIAEDMRTSVENHQNLGRLLNLGPIWRFPVHITLVDPGTPLAAKVKGEATSVIADGKTLRIEAALLSTDPTPREFIQRQFVTALLWEKYFKPDTQFTAATRLDIVPIWLIEGLREWINDDPGHNREEIVKRAAIAQRAPTLAEVTGWQEISDEGLLGTWQRAFCYYLVDSLLRKDARRLDFQEWINSITGPSPASAKFLFPTEMGWQRELLDAPDRSRDIVYSWDESAAEMAAAETIALPKGKTADDAQICTIETVGTFPRTKEVTHAINQKVFELTALELRAHPSWRPIISLYRLGLTALVSDKDPTHAANYLHQANLQRAAEINLHQKLVDYANWYEVTNSPAESSHFKTYFQVAQELDQAEPDPAHPNPLRERLLRVEAQF